MKWLDRILLGRRTHTLLQAHGRGMAAVLRTATGETGCLCGHLRNEHSQILTDNPCLECDCPALMRRNTK